MSTNKQTPKKKSQSPSKKVAQKAHSGAPTKKVAAATSPKVKQKPGPKKGSTRKAKPEMTDTAKKAVAKKIVAKKVAPKANKAIGLNTLNSELLASKKLSAGAADELNAMAKKYKEQIEKGSLRFLEQATTSVNNSIPQVDLRIKLNSAMSGAQNDTKPFGTTPKKKGILSRIASWFRPSKKKTGKKR
jgi:hypothetical protein